MLTQDQIEAKSFKKGLFGFNKDEVNSFMREVASDITTLQTENQRLLDEKEIADKSLMENSVKIYELEKQLEQAAPGTKKEQNASNAEANKIINEAKKKANDVLTKAREELAKLKAEMEEVKATNVAAAATVNTATADSSVAESNLDVDPITKLKMKSKTTDEPQKLKMTPKTEVKDDSKPQAFAGKSAVKTDEEVAEDTEEIFVGEVEEGVNRNQVLIGDGDEDADFEFL